jgi:hypothetical protein
VGSHECGIRMTRKFNEIKDNQKCNRDNNNLGNFSSKFESQISGCFLSRDSAKLTLKYEKNSSPCYYNNLPPLNSSQFISRKTELEKLLINISPDYRQHITVVEGIDGVGKTELVLKAAYTCCKAKDSDFDIEIPRFDAIIFTSIKQTYPTHFGRSDLPEVEPTLPKIFRNIAKTLEDATILKARAENRLEIVYRKLSEQTTLLIIDNLETLDSKDREQVLSFLADLPNTTQAIITTRERVISFSSIRLDELSKDESFQLIDRIAKLKGVSFTAYQKERIYRRFGGIPVALIYAVGRRAMGYSLKAILSLSQPLSELSNDSVKLSFESSIIPLRKQPAHKLLLSLAIFQDAPSKDALSIIAGLSNDFDVEEGLLQLQKLALVQKKARRYYTLATTREYILVELAKYPEFEEEARLRWIEWYLKFTQKYGGKDWQKWREQYDHLDRERENIFSVLYWCSSQDLYQEAQSLWQNIDSYVDLCGHWQTRRYWWKWLIQESDRRADLATYVKAVSERAWTLTLMGDEYQSEAAREFAKALNLHEYAELEVQSRLFCHIAVHRLIKRRYNQALDWLERADNYLKEADLDERELTREQVYINYHKAEVIYWKWNRDKYRLSETRSQERLQTSKKLFQDVLLETQEIGWERFVNYTQSWLGKILIDEGNFREAKEILEEGLSVAIKNRDTRRIAYFQKNLSILHDKCGNSKEAEEFAHHALRNFEREDLKRDAQEMSELLMSLQSK